MSSKRVFPVTITRACVGALASHKPLLAVPGMERVKGLLEGPPRSNCRNCSQRKKLRAAAPLIIEDLFTVANEGDAKALHRVLSARHSLRTNTIFVIKTPDGREVEIDENGKRSC